MVLVPCVFLVERYGLVFYLFCFLSGFCCFSVLFLVGTVKGIILDGFCPFYFPPAAGRAEYTEIESSALTSDMAANHQIAKTGKLDPTDARACSEKSLPNSLGSKETHLYCRELPIVSKRVHCRRRAPFFCFLGRVTY